MKITEMSDHIACYNKGCQPLDNHPHFIRTVMKNPGFFKIAPHPPNIPESNKDIAPPSPKKVDATAVKMMNPSETI